MDIMDMLSDLMKNIKLEKDWEKKAMLCAKLRFFPVEEEWDYHNRLHAGYTVVLDRMKEAKEALEKVEQIKEERNNDEHY